jgi:hypothetical protein
MCGICAVHFKELCKNCAVNGAELSFLQGLPIVRPGDEGPWRSHGEANELLSNINYYMYTIT